MAIHSAAPRWVVVLQNTNLNLFVQATAIGCGKSCRSSHNILQSSQLVNGHSRFLSVGYDGDIDSWDWGALPDFTKRNNGSNNRCGGQYSGSLDRCRNIKAFNSEPKAWFLSETETDRNTFAIISLWGEFAGLFAYGATFSYIVPLPNISLTRLFSNLGLKRKDFQEIARLAWAQEVPSSNLGAPTKTSGVVSLSYRKFSSLKTALWNSGRQEVWIRKSFGFREFAA